MGSIFGVNHDLILALRSQIFEYLRETFYGHALEYLQSACSEKKKGKKNVFPTETPDHCGRFWSPLVGGDTFSPLASVLGPEQKKTAMPPSSTVHGGQYDSKDVTFE